ncbi:MAG: serine hydrolase [Bermanella sp.]
MVKKTLPLFTVLMLAALLLVVTDSLYLFKAIQITWLRGQTDVDIYDFEASQTRTIKTEKSKPWILHKDYNKVGLSNKAANILDDSKTTAFIIIKGGKILTEKYFDEGAVDKLSQVWSVTKTYTSFALLKAVEDGLIESIDDPVHKYIPEWTAKKELTLRYLALMSAGLAWNERDHTPFARIARFNFHDDLEKLSIYDLPSMEEAGKVQHYNSGGTQLLGTVINRVLKDKTLTDYISEKFWGPLGYEYQGQYIIDSEESGNEKSFGGMAATARDISRLGQVLLDDGKWEGQEFFSSKQMETIKTIPYNNKTYAYGLWTGVYNGNRFYMQKGVKGQICITYPAGNLVITRFGHKLNDENFEVESIPQDVTNYIEEAIRISAI